MRAVRLSPVDHIFTGPGAYPIQFYMQYSQHLNSDDLYKGLKSVTPLFWPVAGQLRKLGKQTYEVVWDGSTPNFQVIDCRNKSFPSQADFEALIGLRSSIDLVVGKPLSHFQLYQFAGGSALVANISHCIADGYSFFHFLSQWAARMRLGRLKFLKNRMLARPIHNRSSLVPRTLGAGELQYTDQEVFQKVGISYSPETRGQDVKSRAWRFHTISEQEIRAYRKREVALLQGEKRLSSDDIISALIVKGFLSEGWFSNGLARISTAFDYRRILPCVGQRYFGNAVRAASFEISIEQLDEMSIIEIARKLRLAKASIDIENSLESLCYLERARLEKDDGLRFVQGMRVVDEARGLLITNISRISSELFDFGFGKPTRLIPLTPAERSAVISSQNGGYSVRISPPDKP